MWTASRRSSRRRQRRPTSSLTSIPYEPEPGAALPPPPEAVAAAAAERRKRYLITAAFLAPAIFFLAVWAVYPTIRTIIRSFYSDTGDKFVGFDNYKEMFTDTVIQTAIKNNAIWVAVVPAAVTALGLLFAVLTERVRWAVAFKIVVFAPLAISLFATGVMWRVIYQKDPDQGAINAAVRSVEGLWKDTGVLSGAQPSTSALTAKGGGLVLTKPIQPGQSALLGLTAIPATDIPQDAVQAKTPHAGSDQISGTVWRDFRPGGGKPGVVEQQEVGLGGVTVVLRDTAGKQVKADKTASDGSFVFDALPAGSYNVGIGKQTFAQPFGGVNWLGSQLITPAMIIAY